VQDKQLHREHFRWIFGFLLIFYLKLDSSTVLDFIIPLDMLNGLDHGLVM